MTNFHRLSFLCMTAASSALLASCGGGGGYSGPPGIVGPISTPSATSTTPAATSTTPAATSTTPAATSTTPAATSTTPPATSTTPPAAATTPPATSTTPPATSTTPPAAATTPPAAATTPPAAATTPPAAATTPPAAATTPPAMTAAVCPPTTLPSPVATTQAFPPQAGGSVTNPQYYDITGTTMFPANNAPSGTNLTIKIGGTNYDGFSAPTTAGSTALLYVESSVSSAASITFTPSGSAVVITSTSPSCVMMSGPYTFYMDVNAKLSSGSVVPIESGIVGKFVGTNSVSFNITSSTNQFPGSPTIIQLVISRK